MSLSRQMKRQQAREDAKTKQAPSRRQTADDPFKPAIAQGNAAFLTSGTIYADCDPNHPIRIVLDFGYGVEIHMVDGPGKVIDAYNIAVNMHETIVLSNTVTVNSSRGEKMGTLRLRGQFTPLPSEDIPETFAKLEYTFTYEPTDKARREHKLLAAIKDHLRDYRFEAEFDMDGGDETEDVLGSEVREPAPPEDRGVTQTLTPVTIDKRFNRVLFDPTNIAPTNRERENKPFPLEMDGYDVLWTGSFCCPLNSMFEVPLYPSAAVKLVFLAKEGRRPQGVIDRQTGTALVILDSANKGVLSSNIDLMSSEELDVKVATLRFFGRQEPLAISGDLQGCQVSLTAWIEPVGLGKKVLHREDYPEVLTEDQYRSRMDLGYSSGMENPLADIPPILIDHINQLTTRINHLEAHLASLLQEHESLNHFVVELCEHLGTDSPERQDLSQRIADLSAQIGINS